MVARYQTLPGVAISAPGLPPVVNTDEELRIAALPGLVHLLEPSRFAGSPLVAKDRATPAWPAVASASGIAYVASDASFNNLSVLDFDGSGAVGYAPGTVTPSFTLIMAVLLDQARKTAGTTSYFFNTYTGVNNTGNSSFGLRWQNVSGGMYRFCDNLAGSATLNDLASGNVPAGDTEHVLVVMYDGATRTSRIAINSEVALATHTHTGDAPVIDAGEQWSIGGIGSNGLAGETARVIILDQSYHTDELQVILAQEVAAMRAKYAI